MLMSPNVQIQHSQVIHLAGSENLRYKFIEGPVQITNEQQCVLPDENSAVVEISFDFTTMSKLEIVRRSNNDNSFHITMAFGPHMYNVSLIKIDNFNSSFKIV